MRMRPGKCPDDTRLIDIHRRRCIVATVFKSGRDRAAEAIERNVDHVRAVSIGHQENREVSQ